MSTKYTPAPWRVHHSHGYLVVESDNEEMFVKVTKGIGKEKDLANAQLIAAAPELLESLQWYVENDDVRLEMAGNEFYANGYYKAKAVIAKALGETNGN